MAISKSTLCLIIWFAVYGVNTFIPIPYTGIILGIVAILIAIALMAKK
jgi:hypothetical protein